jgi:hypothetical protein
MCVPGWGTVQDVATVLTPLGYTCGPEPAGNNGNLRCQRDDPDIPQGELHVEFESPDDVPTNPQVGGFSVTVIGHNNSDTANIIADACTSIDKAWAAAVTAIFDKYPQTRSHLLTWWSEHGPDCTTPNAKVIPEGGVDGYNIDVAPAEAVPDSNNGYVAAIFAHALG